MNRHKGHISRRKVDKKILRKNIRKSTIMEDIFKSVLLSAFITLLVLMASLGYYIFKRNIKYSLSMLEEETKSVTTETEHYFKDIISIVDVLTYSPSLYEASSSEEKKELLEKMIYDIEIHNSSINSIFIGYADSTLLINPSIFPKNDNYRDSEWYKNAIQSSVRSYNVKDFSTEIGDTTKFMLSKSFLKMGLNEELLG